MPQIPRLDKFLFAFDLESGGKVVAWIELIFSCIAIFFMSIGFGFILFAGCPGGSPNASEAKNFCHFGKVLIFVFLLIAIGFFSVFAIIARKCIKGIETRNPDLVNPMVILAAISCVLSILSVLGGEFGALSTAIIQAYLFVVYYSIRENYKEQISGTFTPDKQEREPTAPPQYRDAV